MSINSHEFSTTTNTIPFKKYFYEGEVVDLLEADENSVIKVRIKELDRPLPDSDLPLCYPMFNFSFFRVLPKVGERVLVTFRDHYDQAVSQSKDIRFWVSIVHADIFDISFQSFTFESDANRFESPFRPRTKPNRVKTNGVFPNKEDVSISSRNNSDIILRDSQVLIRCGFHEQNQKFFNKRNPSLFIMTFPIAGNLQNKKQLTENFVSERHLHDIILTDNINIITISVFSKLTNKLLFSEKITAENRNLLITNVRLKLSSLQTTYPKWVLTHSINELNNLPKSDSLRELSVIEQVDIAPQPFNLSSNILAADKIFLISHLNNRFNVRKQPNYVTEEDITNFSENAHPIPYGDKLIEFLNLLRSVVSNHVHGFPTVKPDEDSLMQKMQQFNLDEILNKNVLTG